MPVFHYACTKCSKPHRRLCSFLESQVAQACPACGGELTRTPNAPTTHVKEVLDNGAMPKAVERFADAERLYKERAGK